MRIPIIGAGFGGLAAAIRLQLQGHEVTLLEKRDKPGGRAYVFEQDGFTFDAGPTILTAPWLIHDLFDLAGRNSADYVQLVPVDPYYNVRFGDGSVFRYSGDMDALVEQVRAFSPDDVEGFLRFSASTERIFDTGFSLIDKPFHRVLDMLKVVPDLVRLQSHKSVASYVNQFMRDERLRQVFSFHPLLIGGNPFESTSIYALIHHLEKKWGVWFAVGGTGAVVRALTQLFTELGGTIRLNAEVSEILVSDTTHRATGVRLADGEIVAGDAVVSNGDVATTYMQLLAPRHRKVNTDARMRGKKYSMSLFVCYFGTDRTYDHLAHHEILMGPRYRGLLDDIFNEQILSDDFSLYLHRPTATDPSLAPPGCDAWYVLSPVPHLGGSTDWEQAARPYRDRIMQYLEATHMPGLSRHIVTERSIDPRYFRDELNSHLGSAFSVQPTLMQSAWMRPHNVSEDVPNLYLAGAGTHPGAGVPGVLSSGKIVADLIGPARTTSPTRNRAAIAARP
ncbi:MAG: phytoene desaturase [Gemmatimonadaceae bacterium]